MLFNYSVVPWRYSFWSIWAEFVSNWHRILKRIPSNSNWIKFTVFFFGGGGGIYGNLTELGYLIQKRHSKHSRKVERMLFFQKCKRNKPNRTATFLQDFSMQQNTHWFILMFVVLNTLRFFVNKWSVLQWRVFFSYWHRRVLFCPPPSKFLKWNWNSNSQYSTVEKYRNMSSKSILLFLRGYSLYDTKHKLP